MLLESSAGPSASAFAAPAAPPDHWCFITEKAEGPRKAVFSTTVHTPSVPSHPEAQRLEFRAGTEHFAPVGRPPSTMLRASPGSVAFFPQQRQIPSVASSFSHPFSLRGDFHLQGCSQSHLKAPKLHKEEPYSPKVKPTEPFSSQDPVPPTPCGLSLFFLLNNDKRH